MPDQPIAHRLCLMSIRKWVDLGIVGYLRRFRDQAEGIPRGLAGEIAAEVWLHVQEQLAASSPEPKGQPR